MSRIQLQEIQRTYLLRDILSQLFTTVENKSEEDSQNLIIEKFADIMSKLYPDQVLTLNLSTADARHFKISVVFKDGYKKVIDVFVNE